MANSIILIELIEKLNISIAQFERKIDVGSTSIGTAIRRKTNIKSDVIDKIIKTYPLVNRKWLETGEKPMFMKEPIQQILEIPSAFPTGTDGIKTGSEPQKNDVNSLSKPNEKPMEDEFKEMFKQMMTNMQTLIASNGEATIATKEAAIAAKESALAAKEANINNGVLIRSQEKLIDNMLHKKTNEEKGKHPHLEVK